MNYDTFCKLSKNIYTYIEKESVNIFMEFLN